MLILIVECKVFINVLGPVVWWGQVGDSCQLVWLAKSALTFFKVLKADTFSIHRVPVQLASSVVRMAMKGWDNTMEMESNLLWCKNTVWECLNESTHDIIPKADIRTIKLKESLNNCKWVLHPGERVEWNGYNVNEVATHTVLHFESYHIWQVRAHVYRWQGKFQPQQKERTFFCGHWDLHFANAQRMCWHIEQVHQFQWH